MGLVGYMVYCWYIYMYVIRVSDFVVPYEASTVRTVDLEASPSPGMLLLRNLD